MAFGGPCLLKDLRAFCYRGDELSEKLPLIESILLSNRLHLQRVIKKIINISERKIGVLGFAFKSGTVDVRESPIIKIIEHLYGIGYELKAYDRNVFASNLLDQNKTFLESKFQDIQKILVDTPEKAARDVDTIVVGCEDDAFIDVVNNCNEEIKVVDLVCLKGLSIPSKRIHRIFW
jgi:GDP-mannose 6-dehydrogenase